MSKDAPPPAPAPILRPETPSPRGLWLRRRQSRARVEISGPRKRRGNTTPLTAFGTPMLEAGSRSRRTPPNGCLSAPGWRRPSPFVLARHLAVKIKTNRF